MLGSEMSLLERLSELAQKGEGEISIGPQTGQDLDAFQATISFLRDYEQRGYLTIMREHRESRSAERYIDRVRIRLTESGVEHWRAQ
jgi:hypothetical protein